MDELIVQKFNKDFKSRLDKDITYYSIFSALQSLKLPRKQIQLLAYTHVRGTISSLSSKEEFVKLFGSSIDSINNMISKLYKKKLLYKVSGQHGKIKVHPSFSKIDFDKEIGMVIKLKEIKEESNES